MKARDLPAEMPGHWDTPEGRMMAANYADQTREQLTKGEMSDLALANRVFLADRNDLDLIVWQTAAKERIRWLSAQLALARINAGPGVLDLDPYLMRDRELPELTLDNMSREPSDEEKDAAICHECHGTGLPRDGSGRENCFWCDGKGHRL